MTDKKWATIIRVVGYISVLLISGIIWYNVLPAFTLYDYKMRQFIFGTAIGLLIVEVAAILMNNEHDILSVKGLVKSSYLLPVILIIIVSITGIWVVNRFNGPVFRSADYQTLLEPEIMDFEKDFPKMDESSIPLLDRNTAENLGSRKIGEMTDLVSQFVPDNDYTQINIDEKAYRVTPLEHADFFTWRNNKDKGVPGYLQVDMVNGDVDMVTLDDAMQYTHSDYFNQNVKRHLRLKYPTTVFNNPSFEIDDDGKPYYVATTYRPQFFMREEAPTGVIVLDPVTGETEKYTLDDAPEWIDRIYPSNLILNQLNYNGKYKKGYWNSRFGQNGVTQTTSGYNYISIGSDVYLYTGVTSVQSDASNIGFYLVNLRTKEASYYPVNSADESSARRSAEGLVQEKRYTSTFPILINIGEKPMYMLSLKDDSQLVRLYALVDPKNYQDVLIDETIDGLIAQFNGDKAIVDDPEQLEGADASDDGAVESVDDLTDLTEIIGSVDNVTSAVVSGNTIYYFLIDGSVYKADITLNDQLPFVVENDTISGTVTDDNEFKTIELNN